MSNTYKTFVKLGNCLLMIEFARWLGFLRSGNEVNYVKRSSCVLKLTYTIVTWSVAQQLHKVSLVVGGFYSSPSLLMLG